MRPSHQLNRRDFLRLLGLAASGAALVSCQTPTPIATSSPTSAATTAEAVAQAAEVERGEKAVRNAAGALERLIEGNFRFYSGRAVHPWQSETRRVELAEEQKPFATVLSCVDSRVPPEIVFDRGLGDLFVVRTAGHVLDSAALGSIEFGVNELKIPLLLVMGHTQCGAVKATLDAVEKNLAAPDKIGFLVQSIRPAIELVRDLPGDVLDNAVRLNIEMTLTALKGTPLLQDAEESGKLDILGAMYDLDTGVVFVFD